MQADKFILELNNNEITNIDNILTAIEEENNYEFLNNYYNFLTTRIDPELYLNLNIILDAIKNKLNKTKDQTNEFNILLDQVQNTYVELEEVIPLISKYTNNISVNENDLIKIYSFLSNAITLFEYEYNNSLEQKALDILHYTMEYVKNKNSNQMENYLIERYNTYCQKELESTGKSSSYQKKLLNPDAPVFLDDNGISLTIIIITTTILLGVIIGAIILVK